MKRTTTGALLAVAALVGMLAMPAAAQVPGDAGTFAGIASVGQQRGPLPDPHGHPGEYCLPDGRGSVRGPGLTLTSAGQAYYTIDAPGSVNSATYGVGSLNLCGDLHPTLDDPQQVGASCLTTRGSGGQGHATFAGNRVLSITDLGWAATAGGTFLVQGTVHDNGGPAQTLTAVVQALDEAVVLNCLAAGAERFQVVATYSIR